MIQRIQTIYLLLAVAFIMALFYFPLGKMAGDTGEASYFIYGLMEGLEGKVTLLTPFPFGLWIVFVLISFATVLFYKNRPRQIFLCRLLWMLVAVGQGVIFFYGYRLAGLFPDRSFKISPVAFLPLVSMLFVVLALRRIHKDEELVRAADRLR
ncbi:MAG: DUF4293 domain-containing protein [Flavobacteriales bacterium]|nr:DUF4293 domain-containing protein [Flavobacteriales bacterium]MCB9448777.1 DUF4293 domain-containing protein [Flavobacteriales bacterium]